MIRDLIDIATLDDFAAGLARSAGRCAAVYDDQGRVIARAGGESCLSLDQLPANLEFKPLPPNELPLEIAMLESAGRRAAVARVDITLGHAGYVAVSEPTASEATPPRRTADGRDDLIAATRWAARLLVNWCRNEARLDSMAEELALVGDIGQMLAGERDLQTVLDSIVRETSRVMRCKYSSLRLYNPATDELRIAAAYNLSQRYTDIGVILRKENPIDDEALTGKIVYIEDAQNDPRTRFKDEARDLKIRSGLTAPLIHRGEALGVLRVYSDRHRKFRAPRRHLLRAVASQAAVAIDNARRIEERLQSAALERQLALAGDVQARMMRIVPPASDRIQTAMLYEPSSHLGGDYCDVFTLPDGRFAAAIGDVAGHGAAAALLTATVRGALRAGAEYTAEQSSDLPDLLAHVNRHVCRETSTSEFMTLFLVAVDADARRLTYCNAGHEPLMLRRGDQTLQTEEGGLVLGLDPDERYEQHTLSLHPGDFLLLYTDGLIEAANFHGEMFGRRRLLKLVQRYGGEPIDSAVRNIHWDLRRFLGLAMQEDDQTMVALRVCE